MKTSEQGLDLLIQREGEMNHAYRDSEGYWTIGVGHLLSMDTNADFSGLVWTDQQVKDAFSKDIEKFEAAVNRAVKPPLKQCQFDALVSFAFNVGTGGMTGSQVVACINAGNFTLAASAFDNWHKPASIITRRNGEREQFKGAHFVPTYDERVDA